MKIDPSPVAYHPRQQPPLATRHGLERSPPFNLPLIHDVLGETPPGGSDPDGPQVFAATTDVGDPAVSFDARPIVAPTAEAAPSTAADLLGLAGALAPERVLATDGVADVRRAVIALAAQLAAAAPTAPVTTPAAPARAQLRHVGTRMVDAVFGRAPTFAPLSRAGDAKVDAVPRHPSPLLRTLPTSTVDARIAAFDEEVRVVIRGAALTDADRADLARSVTDMLAGTAFAGRAVRVLGSRRNL